MIKKIKYYLRLTYRTLRKIRVFFLNSEPKLPVSAHDQRLIRLGSEYGGWTFAETESLNKSLMVSCGAGEDVSFDMEFAARFNAEVVLVDPTPRAVSHFQLTRTRMSEKNTKIYVSGGSQPVEAYDLENLREDQFKFVEVALWNKNTPTRFFAPKNPSHVSHSIVNLQNDYRNDSPYIEVEAITIDVLLERLNVKEIGILKLDIEGAEIEVIEDLISKKIYPAQVLVEYDELSVPGKKSKERIKYAHALLINADYDLIFREDRNFLYLKNKS